MDGMLLAPEKWIVLEGETPPTSLNGYCTNYVNIQACADTNCNSSGIILKVEPFDPTRARQVGALPRIKIFTIGYGGRTPEDFVKRLTAASVCTVVDVRLRPERASMGVYVKAKSPEKGIERLLASAGIRYGSLPELGNLFLDYEDWRTRYATFIGLAGELLVTRLDGLQGPLCLLCAERKVAECHRLQIAEYLASIGHEIEHLDGD